MNLEKRIQQLEAAAEAATRKPTPIFVSIECVTTREQVERLRAEEAAHPKPPRPQPPPGPVRIIVLDDNGQPARPQDWEALEECGVKWPRGESTTEPPPQDVLNCLSGSFRKRYLASAKRHHGETGGPRTELCDGGHRGIMQDN